MMGIPTETGEDILSTLDFMKKVKPDFASISVYEPFPGTNLFNIGLEKDLVIEEMSLQDYYNRIPSDYYVKDLNKRVDNIDMFEFKKLENMLKMAFHRYNLGFKPIYKRIRARGFMYIHEPKLLIKDLKKFFGYMGI